MTETWDGYRKESDKLLTLMKDDLALEVYEAFRILKLVMNPRLPKTTKEIVEYILGYRSTEKGFIGGIGNAKRTLHENLFGWLFPQYKSQVTFGTGKDGIKNFGCNKVTVDFLNEDSSIAYEIDGSNHKNLKQQIEHDRFKENFLKTKHGIVTNRFTNQYVEDMIFYHLAHWASIYGTLRDVKMVNQHVRMFTKN